MRRTSAPESGVRKTAMVVEAEDSAALMSPEALAARCHDILNGAHVCLLNLEYLANLDAKDREQAMADGRQAIEQVARLARELQVAARRASMRSRAA